MTRKILVSLVAIAMMVLLISCASETEAPTAPNAPDRGTLDIVEDVFFDTLAVPPISTDENYFVYRPAGYDADRAEGYPVVYMLHGFGGNEYYFSGLFDATKVLDKLMDEGEVDPMILVFPSSNNAFGGNFYTDSDHRAVGNAMQHIVAIQEEVDANYNTIDDRAGRGLCGASMGGYGAIRMAEMHNDVFGSASMHAAPLTFDGAGQEYLGVQSLLPAMLAETGYDTVLANTGGVGDSTAFVNMMYPTADRTLTSFVFAASAAWSPTVVPVESSIIAFADGTPVGVDLPFGYDGQLYDPTWQRWLDFDPLDSKNNFAVLANLANTQLYFDAGSGDNLGFNYAHDVFMGILGTVVGLGANIHIGTENGTYSPLENSLGADIPADHTTQTFSRLEGMLKFHNDQF